MTHHTSNPDEIICIVDRSGSMASITDDAIGGFNTFLEQQRAEDPDGRLSLVLFDNEYLPVHVSVPLTDVPKLDRTTFVPRGSTALFDAIGRTLTQARATYLGTPEAKRPAGVTVAILTDGQENASAEFRLETVSAMIADLKATFDWSFVFLAAGPDAFERADALNIDRALTHGFVADGAGIRSSYGSMHKMMSEERKRHKGR